MTATASRRRCWDRAARGGLSAAGRLVEHAGDGVRVVVGDEGRPLSKVTQGMLLRRLAAGESLTEYVYAPGSTPAACRRDAAGGGATAATAVELDPHLVRGVAAKRLARARKGEGDRLLVSAAVVLGDDERTWWHYAKVASRLDPARRRRLARSGRLTADVLTRARSSTDPWGAADLLSEGVDERSLGLLERGGTWAAAVGDPVGTARAIRAMVAAGRSLETELCSAVAAPLARAWWAAGIDPRDAPRAPRERISRVFGKPLKPLELVSNLGGGRGPESRDRAKSALYVLWGGVVPAHEVELVVEACSRQDAQRLTTMPPRALSRALSWVQATVQVPDTDVGRLALRMMALFGKRAPTAVAKFSSLGWSAHDLTAMLPELGSAQATSFAGWALRQDLGWANPQRAKATLRRVAEAWSEHAEELGQMPLREAGAWVRGQSLLPGPAGATALGQLAGELRIGRATAGRAVSFWGASLAVPTFAAPGEVLGRSEDTKLSGSFLARQDPRGLFLGELTDCCQGIGKLGEAAALHGQLAAAGQFFCVVDERGIVVAQSWAWLAQTGAVCFDNIELLEQGAMAERRRAVRQVYDQVAQALCARGVPRVTVGVGYTDKGLLTGLRECEPLRLRQNPFTDDDARAHHDDPPFWLTGYSDAASQRLLAAGGSEALRLQPAPGSRVGELCVVDGAGVVRATISGELKGKRRRVVVAGDTGSDIVELVARANPDADVVSAVGSQLREGAHAEIGPAEVAWLGLDTKARVGAGSVPLRALGWDDSGGPQLGYLEAIELVEGAQDYEALGIDRAELVRLATSHQLPSSGELREYEEAMGYVGVHAVSGFIKAGIGPVEVGDFFRAGVYDLDEMVSYRDAGVQSAEVLRFVEAGVRDPWEMARYLDVGIEPTDLFQYRAAGITSARDMVRFKELGVPSWEASVFTQAGVSSLGEMVGYQRAGVTAGDLEGFLAIGATLEDMVELKNLGVDGRDVEELVELGAVRTPGDLWRWEGTRVGLCGAARWIRAGVRDPDLAHALAAELDVDGVVRLLDDGVDLADFLADNAR